MKDLIEPKFEKGPKNGLHSIQNAETHLEESLVIVGAFNFISEK